MAYRNNKMLEDHAHEFVINFGVLQLKKGKTG